MVSDLKVSFSFYFSSLFPWNCPGMDFSEECRGKGTLPPDIVAFPLPHSLSSVPPLTQGSLTPLSRSGLAVSHWHHPRQDNKEASE
jgi:hypothetical protein